MMICPKGGRRAALLLLCLSFAGATVASAQEREIGPRPAARAVKVAQPPLLDGVVIDDPAWQAAPPVNDFWQTAPDAGRPVSEPTQVRIVYTDNAIYFGVVLWDSSPSGLTVSDSRRDSPLDDVDSFRIILDTYRDRQNGFVFGTNPAALEYDGQVSNEGGNTSVGGGTGNQQSGSGGGFNLNWDGAWRVRTATFDGGWSAEFEIPFRTLRYEPGPNRVWGMNFQRTIRRRKETAFWAPLPIQFDLFRVSLAGTLSGLALPEQRNLKLIPYALAESRTGDRPGREVGLDAKYGITPSLTLDATVNTDFAQVEVDEQQVNLDRFNLFFPEKRPFFLENAGLFSVGSPGEVEMFFSRRIGIASDGTAIPIVAGGRLSGKAGPVNVGLLDMQTERLGATDASNFTVARVRRDFRGRSNIGAMYVGRESTGTSTAADPHNRTMVADGRWGIGQTGLISAFAARSESAGLAADQQAWQIQARNETRPLTLGAIYEDIGRNFNPEVGFLSRTGGFSKLELTAFSRLRPTSRRFQEFRPHTTWRAFWDPTGFQQTGYWHIDNHTEFKNGMEVHTGMNFTREGVLRAFTIYPGVVVAPGTYDHREAQLVYQSNQGAAFYGRLQVTAGGFFGGHKVTYSPQLRLRVGDTFKGELSWDRNDVDITGGRFVTNLARTRLSYSFSPRLFAQALVQYNDRANAWSNNFRIGWLQQANTGLFIVYTDAHNIDENSQLGRLGIGPQRTDRALTIKISRMFDVLN